jgi:hypothetical protein
MTDETNGLGGIQVESNYSAPVEQQSPEPVTVETQAEPDIQDLVGGDESTEAPIETVTPEPSADDKANEAARQAINDRIRADDAERRLKELQPKAEVPDKEPDINDKGTWGDKYKDAPNDLESFLKAHAEWAREDGKREERATVTQAEQARQQAAVRTAVLQKEQESRTKHADYDAVVSQIAPLVGNIPILKDFIAKNPMGTEVAYELAKNPAVLQTLMRSDMWTAGEQLLSMAARLKKPFAIQITKAPEPIRPVGSRETVKPKIADLAVKNIGAYIDTMNKRELNRRRAK